MLTLRHTCAALLVVLTACGTPAPTPGPIGGDPQGSWQLTKGSVGGEALPILDGHRITLTIEGSRIGGTSACNSYGAELSVVGGRLRVGELASTAMACVDDAVMRAEARYLSGLRAVDSMTLQRNTLHLGGAGIDLRFARVAPPPTAELVDTLWLVESAISGDAVAAFPAWAATAPEFELRSDGTMWGATGCRGFEGMWVEQGDEIAVTSLIATDEACPAELQAADSHVLSVVGDGFRASVDGDVLTLTGRGGSGLSLRAAE